MKAKVQNCLNNLSGVFVCWVSVSKTLWERYGIRHNGSGEISLYSILPGWNGKEFYDNIERIIYVMRRHHYFKDFNYPTCRMKTMIAHDEEYAELMAYFVKLFRPELEKAGYVQERGDGVGFCCTSDNKPFLMFGVGKLYFEKRKKK